MPGPPVTIGCAVVLTPGAAGPPDSGFISVITQTVATASGMPLATVGSICQMVNSVSGVPYPLPIGQGGSAVGEGGRHAAGANGRHDSLGSRRADDPRAAGRAVHERSGSAVTRWHGPIESFVGTARAATCGWTTRSSGGFFEDADLASGKPRKARSGTATSC